MSNLLSPKEKRSITRLYRRRFIAVAFFCLMAFALASALELFPSLFFLRSHRAVLADNKASLQGREGSLVAVNLAKTVADINQHLAVFSDATFPAPLTASFIDPVLKIKKAHIHITNLSYQAAERSTEALVQISGTADSRGDLLDFTDTLKAAPGFKNVQVPIASFIKDSNVTFTINASVTLSK
jgi:hypothetical protein